MKKLFTSLVMLMAATLFGGGNLWAGVSIGGTPLTNGKTYNSSNLSAIKSGSALLSSDGKTLTLTDASISVTTGDAVAINEKGITVTVKGSLSITNSSSGQADACLYVRDQTTFTTIRGLPVKVTLSNTGQGQAFRFQNNSGGSVTIYGWDLTATSASSSAFYDPSRTGYIYFYQTHAKLTGGGTGGYALDGFKSAGGQAGFAKNTMKLQDGALYDGSTKTKSGEIYPYVIIGKNYVDTTTGEEYTSSKSYGYVSSGSYKFDKSTNTLKLNNATITEPIIVYGKDIAIESTGTCDVNTSGTCVQPYADVSFTGSGKLNLTSSTYSAISTYQDANVTIEMGEIHAYGKNYGFYGQKGSSLTLKRRASTSSDYFFRGENCNLYTGNLVLTDMSIWTSYTWYNESENKMFYKNAVATATNGSGDGKGTDFYYSAASGFATYDLYVAGTQLNKRNASGFWNKYVKGGDITYDATTKTLKLSNAVISGQTATNGTAEAYGVWNTGVSDLTITTTGTTSITTVGNALQLNYNTTITGSGDFQVTSTSEHAINMGGGSSALTLERSGGTMIAKAKKNAYYGYKTTALTINKNGPTTGGLYEFLGETGNVVNTQLSLGNGVKIHSLYTWYNDEKYAIYCRGVQAEGTNMTTQGTWIRGDVTWQNYDISVAGDALYSCTIDGNLRGNAGGFWNKFVKDGTISYSSSSKQLNFSNVSMEITDDKAAVYSYIDGLTLNATGTNNIKKTTGTAQCAVSLTKSSTIKGSGSNTLNISSSNAAIRLLESTGTLTVKDIKIIADNKVMGRDKSNTLKVENANLDCSSLTEWKEVKLADGLGYAIPNRGNYTGGVMKTSDVEYDGRVLIQPLKSYGILLAGIDVNSFNANDIFADPMYKDAYGKSGSAKFNPTTYALQLNGVNITAPTDVDAIMVGAEGKTVTLQFEGNNTLNASGTGDAIYARSIASGVWIASTTAGSKLNATNTSNNHPALLLYPTAQINNIEVNTNGIMGNNTNELSIIGSTINLSGFSNGTLSRFADISLSTGMNYFKPAGASYNTSERALYANNNIVTGEVQIAEGDTYPLTIAGIEVNSANASNITGEGISGSISYDNSTKKLTLNNASINKTGKNGISSELAELTIELVGDNDITTGSGWGALFTTGNATITGSGSLTTSGQIITRGNLTIENTTVTAGDRLRGKEIGGTSRLTIKNSNVKVNTASFQPITEWGYLELEGCAITTPAGADFSSYDGCLFVGSNKYNGNLVIEPAEDLGITIAGVAVTSKNKDNIVSPYIKSGTVRVSTTGANPVLYLDNVEIDYSTIDDNPFKVYDEAENLFIDLKGTNTIKSCSRTAFMFYGSSRAYTIRGNGATITTDDFFCCGDNNTNNLDINDATINGMSIYNFNTVTVRNSTLNIKGDNNNGTIELINNLVLEGCGITKPEGAEFNSIGKAIYLDGNIVMGDITIEPMQKFGITIAGIAVTDLNADGVTGPGITGNIRWNATQGRLTLDNAAISAGSSEVAIAIDGTAVPNVQIELIGDNDISGQDGIVASAGAPAVTIYSVDGSGTLDGQATRWGADGLALTVRDAKVHLNGNDAGIHGGSLKVQKGAIVAAEASTKALDGVTVNNDAEIVVAQGSETGADVVYAEDYGFSVDGNRVTSFLIASNPSIYNPASKTLFVNNVTADTYIDNDKCDGLTLQVSGANSFNGGDNPVIRTDKPIVIDGTGTISLTSNVAAINAAADITIKGGVNVTVSGGTNAYEGNNVSTLHIDNCVVRLSAAGQVLKDLAGLDLTGVNISEPASAVFEGGTVKVAGEAVSGETIVIGDVKNYGIEVAGIGITTVNAGGVESSDITKGSVTYDDATKTLTLNNAEINGSIRLSEVITDIINIQLIGENTVTCTDTQGFYTKEGGFRFFSDGTGSLVITASGLTSSGVEAKKAITFDNCLVIADGGQRGLSGVTQDCVVTVDNAALRVKGEQSCVAGMKNIVLANGVQANPTADNKAIKVNDFGTKIEYVASGDVVRNVWVDLSEPYNMWIGSVMLTRATAYKPNTEIATGVNYNKETRTLRLENATIDGVWNASGNIINVIIDGECTINSSSYGTGTKKPAIYAGADVNIIANTTTSTLTLDGGSFSPAILGEGVATVTIANHLTAIANGMRGVYSEDKQLTLVVDNATLMAQGAQQSISGLKALVMTGCGIVAPTNAIFNEATGAVELNGSAVSGQAVTIDPSGDGIEGITADDADIEGIYSVDGKKLGHTQSGVNIIRKADGKVSKVLRK